LFLLHPSTLLHQKLLLHPSTLLHQKLLLHQSSQCYLLFQFVRLFLLFPSVL
jgi:hypothetical protein